MRQITYDWPLDLGEPPAEGDILQAISGRTGRPTGTLYLITSRRGVVRREPVAGVVRLALGVERVDGTDLTQPGLRVETCRWMWP